MSGVAAVTVLLVGGQTDSVAQRLEHATDALDVRTTSNAADARVQLSTGDIEIVVSDYELPDADGIELLVEARRHQPPIPFVICSADRNVLDALSAFQQNVTAYLPAGIDDLPAGELGSLIVDVVENDRATLASMRDSARLRALLANTTDAIVTVDTDGIVRDANAALETVLGYPPEQIVDGPLIELIPPDLVDVHVAGFDRYLRTGVQRLDWQDIQLTAQHADGHTVPVSVSFAEFTVDSGRYFTGIIRDSTNRVEAQARLEQQNERLDEFTSVVSHDLRNPINIARGNIQLVRESVDDDRLDTALAAVDTMNDIVSALLALSRLHDIADTTETVSLRDLASEVWRAIDSADATLTITDDTPSVVGDRRAIRQLITNLFQNAVDHVGTGVTVTVGGLPTGFYVADDGDGIPPDRRDDALDAGFTTSDSGTGFGLTIVNRVSDAHDWDITVVESESGGVRFEFTGVDCNEPTGDGTN